MRLFLCLALFALPQIGLAQTTSAQTAPAQTAPAQTANLAPVTASPGAVARLIEAHQLYHLGHSAHDPLLLLTAAHLMQGLTLTEVPRDTAAPLPDTKATDTVADPAQSAPLPGTLTPAALLAEARDMAPRNDLLSDLIARSSAEIAPRAQSVQVTSLLQSPGQETTFSIPFSGGTYGEIGLLRFPSDPQPDFAASGPKAGHLRLTVTDAAGNPVCADASAGIAALCGIVPLGNGPFRVTITNDGTTPAAYVLISN